MKPNKPIVPLEYQFLILATIIILILSDWIMIFLKPFEPYGSVPLFMYSINTLRLRRNRLRRLRFGWVIVGNEWI